MDEYVSEESPLVATDDLILVNFAFIHQPV